MCTHIIFSYVYRLTCVPTLGTPTMANHAFQSIDYMYVCMYVYMYVCMNVYMYIHMYIYSYIHTNLSIPEVPASSYEDTLAKCQLCHFSIRPPVDGKF